MSRILVVDDSRMVHAYVCEALAGLGHVVDFLPAFTELPRYMRATPPDIVLLDLEMPALSGVAFARFIKCVQVRRTPIVVHSSLPRAAQESAARSIGAVGVVPKGESSAKLRAMITQVLESTRNSVR